LDYAEGLFLGKLWSDTDFENRRHAGLFIIYGFLVDIIVVYNYLFGKTLIGIGDFGTIQHILLILLFLGCPFLCFRYYRMPIWGKILILLEKVIKSLLLTSFTVSMILPRLTVKSPELQDYILNYLNGTLEKYTEKFQASAGSFSTVIGVLAGGVHVVFVVLLIVLAAVVVPGVIFLIFRLAQYLYDLAINKFVIKRFFPGRK